MIEELRTFLAVSAAGSIQKAARHLPLTQSAITRQIQRLENELGCLLLDRSVKPPRMTRDGEQARIRGKSLVDEVEAFKERFDPTAEPEGMLRFGIAHAALDWRGSRAVAEAIMNLTRIHPKVTAHLSAGWTPRLNADLNDGSFDAVLVLGRSQAAWPAGANVSLISSDKLVAVAPRSLCVNRLTSFAELFERPWILNPDGCGYRSLLVSLAASMQRTIRIIAEVQGASLQRELVAAGLGVGLVPECIARTWTSHDPTKDDLVLVKPKGEAFAVTAALISNVTTQRLRRPIETMASALTKAFGRRL
jgi:DNA-binding transcriptional LysR family regulator